MSWYKTGTVNVTNGSAAVVGVGTTWREQVKQGDTFRGPDRDSYEVLSVNSDTSITLAENYRGTTQTGQTHSIAPTQGFVRDLTKAVQDLIRDYDPALLPAVTTPMLDSDKAIVDQGGTTAVATLTALREQLLKTAPLPAAAATIDDADQFMLNQSTQPKRLTAAQLRAAVLVGAAVRVMIDTTSQFVDRNALITTLRDVVNPVGIVPNNWHLVTGNGDNTTFRGVSGAYFKARDRAGITAGQRGVLYGAQFSIEPIHVRNNFPKDDAVCIVLYNEGTASGTELAYFGRNPALTTGVGDAQAAIGIDAWADAAIYTTGTYRHGWDALWGPTPATFTAGMIRAPNNVPVIIARESTGTNDVEMVKLNAANNPVFFGQEQITVRDVSPTPSPGADSGTYTTASITSARYTKHNRIVHFTATVSVTNKGTASYLRVPLPIPATVHGGCGSGVNSTDGIGLAVTIQANGTYARVTVASTGDDPLINGKSYIINVSYEVAS